MSSSTPVIRFLLDENVRADADSVFRKLRIDAKRLPKGTSDAAIAAVSRKEKRIVVTNDEDFSLLSPKHVYGVVWLRIPQSDAAGLSAVLQRLIQECQRWEGVCHELSLSRWKTSVLGEKDPLVR